MLKLKLKSIGQVCDDDCVALFTKVNVNIYKDGIIIIVGKRNDTNGLWNIPLAPKAAPTPTTMKKSDVKTKQAANGAINNAKNKQELAAFLHVCAFSP